MSTVRAAETGARRAAPERTRTRWALVAVAESAVAAAAVLLDLALPTLVLLAMAALSLAVRREGPATLGLHRAPAGRLVATALAFAVALSVFQLAVTLPVANHVSGSRQDLSAFDDLQGDVGMLALLLVLSWTLAAVGEEVAYRGYLLTRLGEALGGVAGGRTALIGAVLVSSVLFGLAHTEQGWIGVTVVALDGIAFSWLRFRCGTLWAAVLAHGFNNTLGFVTFFLVGPVHGLW